MFFNKKLPLLLFIVSIQAGCASQELVEIEESVDGLAVIQNSDLTTATTKVNWEQLIENAKIRGPAFLQGDIEALRAGLSLDALKAGRLPRISGAFRAQTSPLGNFSGQSVSLGLNYDLASAIVGFDPESIAYSERLIPLQLELHDRQAEVTLLGAYEAYFSGLHKVEAAKLTIQKMSCERQEQETEVALGTAPRNNLEQLAQASAQTSQALSIYKDELRVLADRVLTQSGISPGAEISNRIVPVSIAKPVNFDTAQCRTNSGATERDELLFGLAKRSLERAQLSRYTQLSLVLPSQFDPSKGLDLDLFISWMIPIIDQGDSRRTVQRARLDLLSVAMLAQDEQLKFDLALSEARNALASIQLQASQMNTRPQPRDDVQLSAVMTCERDVLHSQRALEAKRIERSQLIASMRLNAICGLR